MSLRFFRRFPIIGNLVTLNVSKGGVSVSAGVPGAHVTTGTSGSQVTVGLPGTGLFYTHRLGSTNTARPVDDFIARVQDCVRQSPINPVDLAHALNRQGELGLTDADFTPEGLAGLRTAREWLRDQHGYRIDVPVQVAPSVSWKPVWIALGLVLLLFALFSLAAVLA